MGLKVSVKNFGPINDGEIDLKNLNIFIGANNAGKSYFATLIYTLMESMPKLTRSFKVRFSDIIYNPNSSLWNEISKPILTEVKSLLDKESTIHISPELFYKFRETILSNFKETFSQNLKKNMSLELEKLVRYGKKSFEIKIEKDGEYIAFEFSKDDLIIKGSNLRWKNIEIQTDIQKSHDTIIGNRDIDVNKDKVIIHISRAQISRMTSDKRRNSQRGIELDEFTFDLQEALRVTVPNLFEYTETYYLPAARSGILQGHKILAANVFQIIRLVGTRKVEIGEMPGTIADFITHIIRMSSIVSRPNKNSEIVGKFEKKIIKGTVNFKGSDSYLIPEIVYISGEHEIPLGRASSTISELAPLFLFIRYLIRKNDMVIIEEPEAHLHPGNQRILAQMINALVTAGIKVLITTHSDFLLGQLSLIIKKPENINDLRLVRAEDIEVSFFKSGTEKKGTSVIKGKVSQEEGIDESEFGKIYEELYNEHLDVDMLKNRS